MKGMNFAPLANIKKPSAEKKRRGGVQSAYMQACADVAKYFGEEKKVGFWLGVLRPFKKDISGIYALLAKIKDIPQKGVDTRSKAGLMIYFVKKHKELAQKQLTML